MAVYLDAAYEMQNLVMQESTSHALRAAVAPCRTGADVLGFSKLAHCFSLIMTRLGWKKW